jgi:hypothetical protein
LRSITVRGSAAVPRMKKVKMRMNARRHDLLISFSPR